MKRILTLIFILFVCLSGKAQEVEISGSRKAVRTSGDVLAFVTPVASLTTVLVLQEKAAAVTVSFNTLSEQIKELESRMTANGELQKQIVSYAKTRAVYVEYRKAGYSKKFRSEHEADILLHQAAKKYFDSMGITKLPSVKSLREEYAGLLEQKRKAYAAYKQARSDMKELHNIKANVDYLLDVPSSQEQQKDKQKSRQ